MRRGEIRVASLDPARGSEVTKTRPMVIVSNDGLNRTAARLGRGVVTVVPLTSKVEHVHPFQVLLPGDSAGLLRDSKAQAEQVRSIDVTRLGPVVGHLSFELERALDAALRLHLAL